MKPRNTVQKTAIFTELSCRRDHPTATELFDTLKEAHPNLSLATVYRVLKNAADNGDVLRLHIGTEDRFDGDVSPHCHIICTQCGAIFDAPFPSDSVESLESSSGYTISESHVEFYGICPTCQK